MRLWVMEKPLADTATPMMAVNFMQLLVLKLLVFQGMTPVSLRLMDLTFFSFFAIIQLYSVL